MTKKGVLMFLSNNHPSSLNATAWPCLFPAAFTVSSKRGILTGSANVAKVLLTSASPTLSEAMVRSCSDRSCAALSMMACLSGFISMPRMILVFMFASISRGMSDGSWVMALWLAILAGLVGAVATGMEAKAALDSGRLVLAHRAGTVKAVDGQRIVVKTKDGKEDVKRDEMIWRKERS